MVGLVEQASDGPADMATDSGFHCLGDEFRVANPDERAVIGRELLEGQQ